MALQPQLVPVPLTLGINTKIDDKNMPVGVFKSIENALYSEIGKLKKRPGYNDLGLEIVGGGTITDPLLLAKYKKELLCLSSTSLYSRSPSLNKFSNRGAIYKLGVNSTPVYSNTYQNYDIDSACVENLNIFYWRSGDATVKYSVYDRESKTFLVAGATVAAAGISPRIGVIQNFVYLFYNIGTSTIYYKKFNILNPASLGAQTATVVDAATSNFRMDIGSHSNKLFIAYRSSALSIFSIDQTGAISSTLALAGQDPSNCLDLMIDSASRLVITWGTGIDLKYSIVSPTLTTIILSPTDINILTQPRNCTAIENSSNNYTVYYEIDEGFGDRYIKSANVTSTGTVSAIAVFQRGAVLSAKAFSDNSIIHIPVLFYKEPQNTYFILNQTKNIVGKISPGVSGTFQDLGVLPEISLVESRTYLFPSQIKSQLVSENNSFFSLLGVNSSEINFDPEEPFQNAELGENLHLASSVMQDYDSVRAVEHGFLVFPELTNAGSASVGGFMSDGTYQFTAVYSWTDNRGQIHRSAPATPLTVVLSSGTSTQKTNINVSTLRLTEKSDVIIELYRTENVGDIFYKVTSTTSPTHSNELVDTIQISNGLADASIISLEPLYTTGDVLENTAPPSATIVTNFQNRLLLAGLEDPNQLAYSKIFTPGFSVSFNDTLTRSVKPVGGGITALASIDDKAIIFKSSALFFFSGAGPNNLGQQDDFTENEIISTDVGTEEKNSIVLTPQGLMFKSKKGIYLLSRGLSLEYIGAPVEAFNDLTITSAKVVTDSNQVRFTTSDGSTLVYNYNEQKWSTFENHAADSAEIVEDTYYYLRPDGLLYVQTEEFSDNGAPIKLALETGWMSFAGLQGFKRVYRLLLLGDYKSTHKLRFRVAYDYNDSWVQEQIVNPEDFIDETPYGEDSPYGSGTPYGGPGNVLQMRLDLAIQKCQSIKIRIEDLQETASEGLSISGLLFRIGVLGTEAKINQEQVYGTN